MGNPLDLLRSLGKPQVIPPTDPTAIEKPLPEIDEENEVEKKAPVAGKATKKPLAVTAPFTPKPKDRVASIGVGDDEIKIIPAVTKTIPAVNVNVKDDKGNLYVHQISPERVEVIEPEKTEIVKQGGNGFNAKNTFRDRTKKQAYKHEYMKPVLNPMALLMEQRKKGIK